MWLMQERTLTAGFGLALAIFVVLSLMSYRTMDGLLDAEALTFHTHDVIDMLDDLLNDVTRTESAARGFLLSGDRTYLADYSAARAEIEPEIQQLQKLTADNPAQQQLLDEFKTQVTEKLAFIEQTIALRSRNDIEGMVKLMESGPGRGLMESIQQKIVRMTTEEKRLLQLRTALAHRDAQRLTRLLIVGSLISLGILTAVFRHLAHEVRRRRLSEARLQRVNHLFYTLSQTNQAIVRNRDATLLLNQVCAIAIERRFFRCAAVGLLNPERDDLRWVATSRAGSLCSDGPWLPFRTNSSAESAARPIHLDVPFVANNIASDPRNLHERENALAQGIHSAGIFPLRKSGTLSGVLGVYAAEPDVFDEETVALLDEVAEDISFALQSIEHEEQRKRAEDQIRQLNQDLESKIKERTADLAVLNRELEGQNRELARASQLKSNFVSRMSHELRTPLNAMSGYLDLLAEESAGELNPKQKRYLGHIRTGADHLLELVNEVLDLSKIEAGRIQLYPEWFNAGDALADVLASTQPLASARNIQVEHRLNPDLVIYVDHLRFKQILYNLISNALKFTPEGGHVTIDFAEHDGTIHVSVTDNGIGIPVEEQRAIFDEFHQAATAKGVKEGTGLGLSITKRLIEQQGGRIWVNSEPGKGSQFVFTVPVPQAGRIGNRR
jgi:signal transduction histidine kinase